MEKENEVGEGLVASGLGAVALALIIGALLSGCGIRFEYYGKTGIDDNYRHATHLVQPIKTKVREND